MSPLKPGAGQPYTPGGLSPAVSDNIRIARVLGITFMMLTHVTGAFMLSGPDFTASAFDYARFAILDTAGRSSVPLLSVLSAYLACRLARPKTQLGQFVRKARSLLIPMILWSLPFIGFFLWREQSSPGAFESEFGFTLNVQSALWWLSGIGMSPPNFVLDFLRDIFVLSLLLPVLVWCVRKAPIISLCVAALISIAEPKIYILLRPQLLFFYMLGIFLAFDQKDQWQRIKSFTPYIVVAFLVIGAALSVWHTQITHLAGGFGYEKVERVDFQVMYKLQTVHRILGVMTFWILADWIRRQSWNSHIIRLEPFIFIAFCSHLLLFRIGWDVFNIVLWPVPGAGHYDAIAHALYPFYWIGLPVLAIVGAVIGSLVLNAIAPPVFSALNGGRRLPDQYGVLFRRRRPSSE